MILIDFNNTALKCKNQGKKTIVFDPIRKKWVAFTTEEHIRQLILDYLISNINYPAGMFAVEKSIEIGSLIRRFDIVIYGRNHKPWMLVECKSPDVEINEKTLHQLLNYQSIVQCRYWLLTNGHQTFCADSFDTNNIKWLTSLPDYDF